MIMARLNYLDNLKVMLILNVVSWQQAKQLSTIAFMEERTNR